MEKILVFFSVLMVLSGCSTNENMGFDNVNFLEEYEGEPLEIGVVGSEHLPTLGNVYYDYTTLNETNNDEEFDALIIMSEAFNEADNPEYINFYNTVNYPIFFFGMKNLHMFAFTNENMNVETSKDYDEVAYVQGFKNVNNEKEGIEFFKGDYSDEQLLIKIFNYVNENFKK